MRRAMLASGQIAVAGDVLPRQVPEENMAAELIGLIPAGETSRRSDHFFGTTLDGRWTGLFGTGAAATVKNSVLNLTNTSGANSDVGIFQQFAPSGAFRLETRILINGTDISVLAASNLATLTGADQMAVTASSTTLQLASRDAGTFTARASASVTSSAGSWLFLSLARDASNVWTGQYSKDRMNWTTIGTYTKAFTTSYILLDRFVTGSQPGGFDFVDVVA